MAALRPVDSFTVMSTTSVQTSLPTRLQPTSAPPMNRLRIRNRRDITMPASWSLSTTTSTRLQVFRGDDFAAASSSSLMAVPLLAAAMMAPIMHMSPDDPLVEAEVLTDLAHVTLDVATLFGPSRLGIRLSSIIGRIFVMAADYVPDHTIVPEEMVFQVCMLCLALFGVCKSALPFLLAATSSVSFRHGKVYHNLFAPSGMSWRQFKAMDVLCMDWITVDAEQTIDDTNTYLYWLYEGNVAVSSNEKMLYNMTASSKRTGAEALLGEAQLMDKIKKKKKKTSSSAPAVAESSPAIVPTTIRAGREGATLLRIHIPKLEMLMKIDIEMKECMRNLAFQGLQDKLAAQLTET